MFRRTRSQAKRLRRCNSRKALDYQQFTPDLTSISAKYASLREDRRAMLHCAHFYPDATNP
jgi:hypothetical protein